MKLPLSPLFAAFNRLESCVSIDSEEFVRYFGILSGSNMRFLPLLLGLLISTMISLFRSSFLLIVLRGDGLEDVAAGLPWYIGFCFRRPDILPLGDNRRELSPLSCYYIDN